MAAFRMAVGNGIGADLENLTPEELAYFKYGSILLEIDKTEDVAQLFEGVKYKVVGHTNDRGMFSYVEEGVKKEEPLAELIKAWQEPLEGVFPVRTDDYKEVKEEATEKAPAKNPVLVHAAGNIAKPRIIIPAFPGTNCEMDSRRAFERAGGLADIHIMRNLTPEALIESIDQLAEKISQSQIVMLPGGFSGGDEPDGSAKFITAVFRNPKITEAVTDLLENRDGLMLGICNGFQTLVKLGLVPYGKIVDADVKSPTLFNEKRYVITVKRTHELSDCVTKIFNTRRQTLTNELLRTAELLRFFAIIIGDQQPEPNRPTDQDWGPSTIRPIAKNGASYVQQAVEYMVANYNQPFRIGELADLIGINRSHLTTRFRKEANMPPAEFLMQLRMDKAESLLRETTFSITEIANMIGYTDALAFSKMFRKRHGVSPRQYRSEAKATRQTNR